MKKMSFIAVAVFSAITLMSFNQDFDLNASINRGKSIYESQCQSCHMAQGEGLEGVFPPLANSNQLGDKNRLIKVVLQGVSGSIKVKGVEYNGEMTGFSLNDQQVADVLNFIRNNWGNREDPIRPTDIQPALKAKISNYQPY